ncbi:hypothetical protein H8B09_15930 [Paenibacillus sp. PR3]|uniref:Uncharacterized protein n=1 Tax=Paenibacillus terricola TaxID=2763503 RepID=A0ABR8MYZ1_9BACL|nr:hypothetical protein [Paenibacillus terricola]MBD3920256.1 hypothetical protein [Paenibacillus terricola]
MIIRDHLDKTNVSQLEVIENIGLEGVDTDPPGMEDPIYFAFDLYAENMLGKTSSMNVELSESSLGRIGRPIDNLESSDAYVDSILKQFDRGAPSNLIEMESWNLFLFDMISIKPKFSIKVNDETIDLEN